MGLLRVAVLGPPEVVHDGHRLTFALRKAQALLLYLAVEGGLHPRSKLTTLLWPDSEPTTARRALCNALVLLHDLLADSSPAAHSHLLSPRELVGFNPQAPLQLDLDVVQLAYKEARLFSALPAEPQRTSLLTQWHHALALVRGPFLDGFWLSKDAPFDEWILQQQQQWQMRLQLLFDRLSCWHEEAGEWEQARATLTRWLALDPLSEEAYRRLMRLHLAQDDATAAWRVYATCRARLAQELQVDPASDTIALAEYIRAIRARSPGSSRARPPPVQSLSPRIPSGELVAPLVGRAEAFTRLVGHYQQARQRQPQAVLVVGEAGIGKTRLAREFVTWARAQGADVLSGHAFEMGGRLPYQPLVEALRPRLEEENAPEDLLEDLWLAELSRLLPELRVRYPDLPTPTQDELTAKVRLFEAVARLLDALARRRPLVLLVDDLQWVDAASLDLLRYLACSWIKSDTRVLLLLTVRREALSPQSQLGAQLADLGRDLPVSQLPLPPLSQGQTLQLLKALVAEQESPRSGGKPPEHDPAGPCTAGAGAPPSPEGDRPLVRLGDWLFAQTGGQPLYLLETLKLLREREWLLPRLSADGTWKLELTVQMTTAVTEARSCRTLVPPRVRALIQARLAKLSWAARQLVMAAAVLGKQASAKVLWQLAELGALAGVEALEEAVNSGLLHEEEAGVGRPGSYRFTHELIRQVVYTELGQARRQLLHRRALAVLHTQAASAAELVYHVLAAEEAQAASDYSVQAGNEAVAVENGPMNRSLLADHQRLKSVLLASEVEPLYACLGRA